MAAARPTARAKVTDLQLAVLRALSEHPALPTASHIADHLGGGATTWGVCEAIGSMRVDGLLRVEGGYQLTEEGAAAAGVEYTPRSPSPTPAAAADARGQLGLFGGMH